MEKVTARCLYFTMSLVLNKQKLAVVHSRTRMLALV